MAVGKALIKFDAPVDLLHIPEDLAKLFSKNKKAKINFENFPPFAKRQFLYWINALKKKKRGRQELNKRY